MCVWGGRDRDRERERKTGTAAKKYTKCEKVKTERGYASRHLSPPRPLTALDLDASILFWLRHLEQTGEDKWGWMSGGM